METTYTQTLTQEILYIKYVTKLNKIKVNGKKQNSQGRGVQNVYINSIRLF